MSFGLNRENKQLGAVQNGRVAYIWMGWLSFFFFLRGGLAELVIWVLEVGEFIEASPDNPML